MFPECERCGVPAIMSTTPARLVGGVSAALCSKCTTEWNKHAAGLSEYRELARLTAVQASIVYARELSVDVVDPSLERVQNAILESELQLHGEGLRWLGRA